MAPGSRPYFPQLDGVRAFAILLVLIGHSAIRSTLGMWALGAQQLAKLGVLVFFVLSGFLITTLMCAEEGRSGRIDLRAFYARRAFRIFPAMLLFVGICSVLSAVGLIDDLGWVDVGAALLYVRNIFGHSHAFNHLWSLSIEEQFYLVWPLTMVLAPRRARVGVASVAVVAVAAWRAVAVSFHLFDRNVGIYYERSDFRFDSILVGCALALALHADHPRAARVMRALLASVSVVLATLTTFVIAVCVDARPSAFGLTAETLLVALLVGRIVVAPPAWALAALTWAPLRWVGRISYSWYLWQELFLVVRHPDWGWVRTSPVDVIASFAVAAVSYYGVERPFLRLKEALERAGERRASRTRGAAEPGAQGT